MKVVQFGLCYSPNVGDGIIAECFAHGVRCLRPGAVVAAIDISGRSGFGAVTVRNRELALKVLRNMPRVLRQRVVLTRLNAMLDRVVPEWERIAADADLAVIGGGQVFSDADLNFPAKIARASDVVRRAGLPLAIYAVGASQNWSGRGRALFRQVYAADLRIVGVRDAPSCEAWLAETDEQPPLPEITRDPGLLAASCYGRGDGPRDRVGVCVTSPDILSYHADRAVAGSDTRDFFAELVTTLAARGHPLRLFCNGAEEDRRAVDRLVATPEIARLIADGTVEIAPHPETPAALAALIAGTRAVVAHRLHACIVAYSYALPVIGLGWDRKVESFFGSVGLDRFFFGGTSAPASEVADRLDEALAAGLDDSTHARAIAEAWDGIDRTLTACGALRAGGA